MQALLLLLALAATQGAQEGREPAEVRGAIQPPKKLKNVSPEYPEDARKAGLQGVVVLECTIDTEGRVTKVDFLKGPVPLKEPAVKAVEKWRYSPTLLDGRAVPVIMTVTVNFEHSRHVRLGELIDSLRNKDEYIREAAAQTLGRLGPQAAEAVPALMKAVHDESERVRKAAAEALESVQRR
jgi:TonB family protein